MSQATGRDPLGVAVIGCGNISNQYLRNLTAFPDLAVLICADLDAGRAKAQAAAYGVPEWGSPADALAHPGVELIVNLTVPAAHAEVTAAAIAAGRHVWSEKPLTLDVAGGRALLAAARAAGVRVGCAPDTVLGAGLQSARRLIDSGAIGTPLTALTLLQGPGPQSWHPDPEFLFAPGAGPLFDLGPYYLSVLAVLFGPARPRRRHRAQAARVTRHRLRARKGTEFAVAVPTYVAALAEYAGGQAASLLFSWDSPLHRCGLRRDHRHRGDPRGARPEPLRRRPARPPGGRRRLDRDPGRRARRPGAAWASSTWPAPSGPARRTAPRASWRCTCWR